MKILLSLILYLSVAGYNQAETLNFELYEVNDNGERVLIEQGSKKYSIADFVVTPEYRGGKFYGYSKEVELARGYSVGTLEIYDAPLTGFGIWVNHLPLETNPNDFSWEWFSKIGENQFKKLQGGALVDINVIKHPEGEELVYLKFNSDVELDYKADICCKKPGDYPSHIVILKAGSVLVFPSIAPSKMPQPTPKSGAAEL